MTNRKVPTVMDDPSVAAAANAYAAAWQRSGGRSTETLVQRAKELSVALSRSAGAGERLVSSSRGEFPSVAGTDFDSPQGLALRMVAEQLSSLPPLYYDFRLAEGHEPSEDVAKLIEDVKWGAEYLDCSENLSHYLQCIHDRIYRLEVRISSMLRLL